jgi:excisionase family DNA binding protein
VKEVKKMSSEKTRKPVQSAKTEQYLRPLEVARMLKMNVETVYHYIKTGKLPAAKLGRRYIVARGDLNEFLENRKGEEALKKLSLTEKGESMVGKVVKDAARVRTFLEEYPGATNEEIAEALGIEPEDTLRALRKLEVKKTAYCEADEGEADRKKDPWYPGSGE